MPIRRDDLAAAGCKGRVPESGAVGRGIPSSSRHRSTLTGVPTPTIPAKILRVPNWQGKTANDFPCARPVPGPACRGCRIPGGSGPIHATPTVVGARSEYELVSGLFPPPQIRERPPGRRCNSGPDGNRHRQGADGPFSATRPDVTGKVCEEVFRRRSLKVPAGQADSDQCRLYGGILCIGHHHPYQGQRNPKPRIEFLERQGCAWVFRRGVRAGWVSQARDLGLTEARCRVQGNEERSWG